MRDDGPRRLIARAKQGTRQKDLTTRQIRIFHRNCFAAPAPAHGTAFDIAGQGKANPMAMILSAAMMLEWLGLKHDVSAMVADGQRLREAVEATLLQSDALTPDLGGPNTTNGVAQAVLAALSA